MTDRPDTETTRKGNANVRIAVACVAFFTGMIGLAYASVPLYQLFCQVTGFGGTTQRAEQAPVEVLDQTVAVRFDANVGPGIGWDFKPVQRRIETKIGAVTTISYMATNNGTTASTGAATFNVTPQAAGAYFNKIDCFCFNETTLQPGESLDMPVVFFVDPDMVNSEDLRGISTITLSYTFFPVDEPADEKVNADTAQSPAAAPQPTRTTAQAPEINDVRG